MLQHQTHLDICQHHLDHYDNEHVFLDRIITGDETWIHYCELESKRQSIELETSTIAQQEKVQKPTIHENTDAYSFWDSEGPVLEH
jgi:hypothetical protein